MGIAKDGTVKDEFARGYALLAKQTVFAEGCRGSCSEAVMESRVMDGMTIGVFTSSPRDPSDPTSALSSEPLLMSDSSSLSGPESPSKDSL